MCTSNAMQMPFRQLLRTSRASWQAPVSNRTWLRGQAGVMQSVMQLVTVILPSLCKAAAVPRRQQLPDVLPAATKPSCLEKHLQRP